ncbi:MAG TPA: AAA family ATPase [Methylomirabilota bacterium]|nr:AAA family ATPase [Methylomirabilota bacterium]
MYASFFGLVERPFSIAPDPRFLYLSTRHREALAHLLYGVGEAGGFVQLTGEVGTGKTTVCRYFLQRLPGDVDAALILNPRLTALELMATVCDELRVPYPSGSTSLKVLVDALYHHLLEAHGRGRRTVLIIDEAQNLSAEVLEQIRLLTNLETTREKLLQIILIGQPELVQLLDGKELRQLAQRVTARYHLLPFTESETRAYILHRLGVAGQPGEIFDQRALREVHRLSRGIPRLINVICDRALLGAYASDAHRIDAALVRRAGREVFGRPRRRRHARQLLWAAAGLLVALAGASALLTSERAGPTVRATDWQGRLAALTGGRASPTPASVGVLPTAEKPGEGDGPAPAMLARASAGGAELPDKAELAAVLADGLLESDRASAFTNLYSLWHVEYRGQGGRLACEAGRSAGLECLSKRGTWNVLRRFNLPAVVELVTPAGVKHYATVTAVDEETATLEFGQRQFTFPLGEIERFWDGAFTLLWKPPTLITIVPPGTRGKEVAWVRLRLGEVDGGPVRATDVELYDEELRRRVAAFQRDQSLLPDGIVGPETLARLVAIRDPSIPSLGSARR